MTLSAHLLRSIAGFFVITLVVVWLLSPPQAVPARYGEDDCRHVPMNDPVTGRAIVGAEDLLYRADGTMVVFSAHDRRDGDKPNGGLYAIRPWDLDGVAPKPRRLYGGAGRSFRPHGIALSPDGRRLALVNRPADGPVAVLTGQINRHEWRVTGRVRDPRLCRANDLSYGAFGRGRLYITIDRGACGFSVTDLAPGFATGTLVSTNGGPLALEETQLSFPNGIAPGVLAETRGARLRLQGGGEIALPGGPDNLSIGTDGRAIAAVHPKLFLLFLGLSGYFDRVPSRIVAADLETGAVEVLFDDPGGHLFSGATSAILLGDRLIAGSAIDRGLLVCGSGF